MTHRHELGIEHGSSYGLIFYCRNCKRAFNNDEIERRFNATERLSAEDARYAERWLADAPPYKLADMLKDYASALEGSDEV